MKNLRLIIGIIVILAVVFSPALAISMSDLIAQHQGQYIPPIPIVFPEDPLNSMSFADIPCNCFDCNLSERYRAPDFTEVHNIAVPIPTTIPTKPMPTTSPLTLDIYVDPFPATLFPSYYEYSRFPAPPAPEPYPISDEEWEEMMAEAGVIFGECPPMHYESGMVR